MWKGVCWLQGKGIKKWAETQPTGPFVPCPGELTWLGSDRELLLSFKQGSGGSEFHGALQEPV